MKLDWKRSLTLVIFSVILISSISVQPQFSEASLARQYPILAEEDTIPFDIPVWVVEPTDMTYEFGEYVLFTLNATSPAGFVIYWISDVEHFEFSYMDGRVWSNGVLDIGSYPLTVAAMDDTYTKIIADITIYIVDSDAPIIQGPNNMELKEGEGSGTLVWNVYDVAPHSYKISKDDVLIESGSWNDTVESFTVSFQNLTLGRHIYTLELSDTSGNSTIDNVIIEVVTDEPIPPVTESTTTTDITDSTTTMDSTDSITSTDETITSFDDSTTPSSPSTGSDSIFDESIIVLLAGSTGIISVIGVISFLLYRKISD